MDEIKKDSKIDGKTDSKTIEKESKTVEKEPYNVIEKKLVTLIEELGINTEKLKELRTIEQKQLTLKNQIANTVLTFQEDIRDEILSLIKPDTTDKTDNTQVVKSKLNYDLLPSSFTLTEAVKILGYTGLHPSNLALQLERAGFIHDKVSHIYKRP